VLAGQMIDLYTVALRPVGLHYGSLYELMRMCESVDLTIAVAVADTQR